MNNLPWGKNTRQRPPGTRQRMCREDSHGKGHTAMFPSAKNICRVLSGKILGKVFAVCLPMVTAQNMCQCVSELGQRGTISLPCATLKNHTANASPLPWASLCPHGTFFCFAVCPSKKRTALFSPLPCVPLKNSRHRFMVCRVSLWKTHGTYFSFAVCRVKIHTAKNLCRYPSLSPLPCTAIKSARQSDHMVISTVPGAQAAATCGLCRVLVHGTGLCRVLVHGKVTIMSHFILFFLEFLHFTNNWQNNSQITIFTQSHI